MLPAYGVLMGTFDHAGEHQGRWLHALLYVTAQGQTYECAVDVNEPTAVFQYQVLNGLDQSLFQALAGMADGYHPLASTPASGAMDYARSPILQPSSGWTDVTGDEAGEALVALATASTRLFVFGAPYDTGLGMHDVHCNQGDPVDSQFHAEDGIWQDGCVFALNKEGTLSAYLGKFASQVLNTDGNGLPV